MTETNQLLREYTNSRSEQAFGELVKRYLDLVYSVAVRRMGRNEDLARKAFSLRAKSFLGGWLHRHTCFVSATLLRAERRRLAREQIAVEMNQLNEPSDAAWHQLAPALDEAIDQPGEADRQAIVLRYYEHRDLRSVGAALGTNEDAAQKRLSRALEKLPTVLSAKGVSLSATALASLLTARAVRAALTGRPQTVGASAMAASAEAGLFASLITLMTSLKIGLTMGIATVLVVAGALLYSHTPGSKTDAHTPPTRRVLVAQVDSRTAVRQAPGSQCEQPGDNHRPA